MIIITTHDQLIDAAVELFSENGYHKTTMDDIAREAGVAKGTVYYNFSSKAKLFAEIVVTGIEMIIKDADRKIDRGSSAEEQLAELIKCSLNIHLKYRKLASILINEIGSSLDEKARLLIDQARERYYKYICNIVEKGIAEGDFKSIDFKLGAGALMGIIEGVFTVYNTYSRQDLSEDEIVNLVQNIFLDGLRK